jgi:integrase
MPKRSNLEGTKRVDGRWEIRVTLTKIDGSKVRKSVYGDTKAEAQQKAHQLIHEDRRSIGSGATVSDLAAIWKGTWGHLAPATKQAYTNCLAHIEKRWGNTVVDQITTPLVVNWIHQLDLKPRTIEMTRTVFGTLLQHGKMIGTNRDNPLAGVRLKRRKPVQKQITDNELKLIIESIDERYRTFFKFLADTGLRPWCEALQITREDNIGRSMDEFYVIVKKSKTDTGERIVPISDREVIDHILDIPSGRIFPFTYDALRQAWRRARTKLEIDVDVYSLRRLAITNWCEERPLDEVQRLAGHANLSLTLEIYNKVRRNRLLGLRGVNNGVKVSDLVRGTTKNQ